MRRFEFGFDTPDLDAEYISPQHLTGIIGTRTEFSVSILADFFQLDSGIDAYRANPGWHAETPAGEPDNNHLQHGIQKGDPVPHPLQLPIVTWRKNICDS